MIMGWKLSAGLGLALAITAGAFKLYYDKSQAEIDAFHIRLEQSIQNQKTLESTIETQNENLKETIKNQNLMLFSRGKAISGDITINGNNQFPNPPIKTGITIKKIITKACAVTITL